MALRLRDSGRGAQRDAISRAIMQQAIMGESAVAPIGAVPPVGMANGMSPDDLAQSQFAYQGHSPASTFDFSAGGVFDPGSSPTMQGGEPTPTGRDFGSTPAQDWGGVNDPFGNGPNPDPTMTSPDMTASPNAVGTFDTGRGGMPSAPSFDITPGSGSFNAPGGFGQGFSQGFSEGLSAGLGGIGGVGGEGGGAVGGMDTSGSGSSESGSSGVG